METATRELYWNISNYWFMYVLFIGVVACFAYFLYKRYRLWKLGAPQKLEGGSKERIWGAITEVFSQRRVLRDKEPGLMHLGIFWGFLFCLMATILVAFQAYTGVEILVGYFYLWFQSLAVDLAGFVCIVGVCFALVRRFKIRKLSRVNSNLEYEPADIWLLVLLLIILITGFVVEGLRILGTNDPWAYWSPIGFAFAQLFTLCDEPTIELFHQITWWGHMVLAFAFLAMFTYTKMVHALFIPGNIYFRSLKPKGAIEPIDFEDEELDTMGVRTLEEFTWKDIYDTQACIRCCRCQVNCPAFLSGKELSPKNLIQDMKRSSEARGKVLLGTKCPVADAMNKGATPEEAKEKATLLESFAAKREEKKPLRSEEQEAFLEEPVVGTVISEEALWQCTTCRACAEECPARIDQPEKIIKLRTYQVSMESAFPSEAQQTFRNMETNGNPWGIGWQKRSDWASELGVLTLDENPDAEYLYWPGCSGAFDARSRKVATATVKLLQAAGVNFAILGNAEKCCGDSARRLGNEYLYFLLASENIETLNSYGVKKIVTQCPHCLHALSVDYPQMGGNYEVVHHSQLLAKLIAEGKLQPGKSGFDTVTYHDSCYLGRYHDIFEQPRSVLDAAGTRVVEMDRHHSRSFCCGAGGGHMWLEEREGKRINNMRAEEALSKNTDAVATACPFCLTMLTDGVAANEGKIPVKDIAEVLADSLQGDK